MPARISKRDGRWIVADGRRVYGQHPDSLRAAAQARTIEDKRMGNFARRFLNA